MNLTSLCVFAKNSTILTGYGAAEIDAARLI